LTDFGAHRGLCELRHSILRILDAIGRLMCNGEFNMLNVVHMYT
jgi:hypothetical protein